MIKITMLSLALLFACISCKKKNSNCPDNTCGCDIVPIHVLPADICIEEKYGYTFKNNSNAEIKTFCGFAGCSTTANITSGNKKVFIYNYSQLACVPKNKLIYFENFIFEIDPLLNNFNFNIAKLDTIKCFYTCYNGALYFEKKPLLGTVIGNKINDNKWCVKADLQIDSQKTLKFSKEFTIE